MEPTPPSNPHSTPIKSEELEEIENATQTLNSAGKIFNILPETGFKHFSEDLLKKIEENSRTINPIVSNIFNRLIRQCLDGFDFSNDKISFDEYMEFWKEVNRITPKGIKIQREEIFSSLFYIGDTHGAVQESFFLIDYFYRIIQKNSKVKIIFLGDYVDRNPNDLENLSLIVAFSLLCPNNVALIRGNHEDRLINMHYGFMDNLLRTFWDKGEIIYEEIIKYFIHLPIIHLAHIHSSSDQTAMVMGVHGGIPIDTMNFLEPLVLKDIEIKLICEVEESKDMDPYTTSMLWSDPDEMIKGILTGRHLQGRMRFGQPVFNAFMSVNNLDLMVRGHQKWKDGAHLFFNGRLYSIFSTASYDGHVQFAPKFLRLDFGKAPKLISINEESLRNEFENEFNEKGDMKGEESNE
ncbi:MAG: metallophosphoesterase family protein [Promethearchaeota archaeon]